MNLKKLVEDNSTGPGRVFDLMIQLLILFSLICFAVETIPDLSPSARRILTTTEVVVVMLFSLEYGLRVYVAKPRAKFVFSFFGMIDLMSILPFFLTAAIDLRSIRIIRLVRVFRAFKMLRYSTAIQLFLRAFRMVRAELVIFFAITIMLLYICSVGIYYFEHEAQPDTFGSVFHAMWWATATLTTVGYGDVCPITAGGKVFTFVSLMIGLGIVAVPSGLLASALTKAREDMGKDEKEPAEGADESKQA